MHESFNILEHSIQNQPNNGNHNLTRPHITETIELATNIDPKSQTPMKLQIPLITQMYLTPMMLYGSEQSIPMIALGFLK